MRKVIAKIVVTIAVIVFVLGLVIVACESPTFIGQMRNTVMGFSAMFMSLFIGLVGEKIGAN